MPQKKSPAASSSKSSAPAAFNFKGMKRQKTSATSSPAAPQRRRETSPTTAWVRRTVYQSGEKEGEPTNNWLFVFNPRYGENDNAKAAVEQHTLGSDTVSGFNSARCSAVRLSRDFFEAGVVAAGAACHRHSCCCLRMSA